MPDIIITIARKPLVGTMVENVKQYKTGGMNINKCGIKSYSGDSRWPANLILEHKPGCSQFSCVPDCPVAEMDRQSGIVPTGSWCRQRDGAHPFGDAVGSEYDKWKEVKEPPGGASRYFLQLRGGL